MFQKSSSIGFTKTGYPVHLIKKETAGWWTVFDALGHLCYMQHHDIRSDVLGWDHLTAGQTQTEQEH